MKRLFVCFVIVALGILMMNVVTFAQQKGQEEVKRDLLITNLNALRNQELRVAILQQLVNEETAKLLQMQAIFSDQYNLEPNKLRAGLYQYDEKTGQFVERKTAVRGGDVDITGLKPE